MTLILRIHCCARPPLVAQAKRRKIGQKVQQASDEAVLETALAKYQPKAEMAKGVGPRAALRHLTETIVSPAARRAWAEENRIHALLDSCPRSHGSFMSGVKCWAAFARAVLGTHGREFPPTAGALVAWSRCFRHPDTFGNYVAHVRLGCHLLGVDDTACSDPSVKRAKKAVRKRLAFVKRQRMFIGHAFVHRIVTMTTDASDRIYAMLFLATYVFLLRLPSEALPMARVGVGYVHGQVRQQSVLSLEDGRLCLRLARRKNLPSGSKMYRECWCDKHPETCPVHVLWKFFAALEPGARPFMHISASKALMRLRAFMGRLGEADACKYRTHDLRRGHTRDMQLGTRESVARSLP